MAKQQDRKPLLVVWDDYSATMTGWRGLSEDFDLLTPIDFNPDIRPLPSQPVFQQITNPFESLKLRFLREGEVKFTIRERLPEPPAPPYNTVDTDKLADHFYRHPNIERVPA